MRKVLHSLPKSFHPKVTARGVHQTALTAPKPSTKWHNHNALPEIVHHTAWYSAICDFMIKKNCTNHTTPSLYINVFIFLINKGSSSAQPEAEAADIDEDVDNYDDEGDDVPLAPTAPPGPLDQYQQLHAILTRMGTNMTVNQAHIEY